MQDQSYQPLSYVCMYGWDYLCVLFVWLGLLICTLIRYLGLWVFFLFFFFFTHLYCLVGCLSMIVWTYAVLGVLYACVLHFCICTCSVHLSMFHMERRSRNTLNITIINIIATLFKNSTFTEKQKSINCTYSTLSSQLYWVSMTEFVILAQLWYKCWPPEGL